MDFFQEAFGLFANFPRQYQIIKSLHPPPCIVFFFWNSPFDNCSICAYRNFVSTISLRFVSNVIFILQLYNAFKLFHLSNNSFRSNFSKLGSRDHTA